MSVFLIMIAGYIFRLAGLISEEDIIRANKLTFKIFLPIMLFYSIYSSDLSTAIRPKLLLFAVSSIIVMFFLCIGIAKVFIKDRSKRSVAIIGMFRSNFIMIGIPIAGSLVVNGNTSIVAFLIAIIIPLFNVLSVICLEVFSGVKVSFKKIMFGIVTNPLIIGSVVGAIALLLKLKLPMPIDKAVGNIAQIGTPLMLFVLGAFFKFDRVMSSLKELVIVCITRLIVIPGIFLTLAYFLGFRGMDFAALIGVFGSSIATNTFTMAQQMNGDVELAGNEVVFSSALCSFTLFFWCLLFKTLNVF